MNHYFFIRYFVVLFCFFGVFSESEVMSQGKNKSITRHTVADVFAKGEYAQAYAQASSLLKLYPKDPLYKYYAGVSLVNLKMDYDTAIRYLSESNESLTIASSDVYDVLFWLGRAHQQAGHFEEAIDFYREFSSSAGKKKSKRLGVQSYIQQCKRSEGAVAERHKKELTDIQETVSVDRKTDMDGVKSSVIPSGGQEKQKNVAVPEQYENILTKAMKDQAASDSLHAVLKEKKKAMAKMPGNEKERAEKEIAGKQAVADSLQKIADSKFDAAQKMAGNAVSDVSEETVKDNYGEAVTDKSVVSQEINVGTLVDSNEVLQADKTSEIVLPDFKKPSGVTSLFEYKQNPLTKNDAVVINPVMPAGLIYRIQVAVFKNPVKMGTFKGLTPVYGIKAKGSAFTTYYTGMFRLRADADKALSQVRKVGFRDAFIVSYLSGKAISGERAASLEKEWGSIPFTSSIFDIPDTAADTLPPVLTYRVEILRVKQPVKEDVLSDIKRLAGTRGLDITLADDGNVVYLVGKFISYESAENYANIVSRNGFPDAKVVARLGNKEIPLATAKQLFEML